MIDENVSTSASTPEVAPQTPAAPVATEGTVQEQTVLGSSTTGTVTAATTAPDASKEDSALPPADPELEAKPGFQNLRSAYEDLKSRYAQLEASQGGDPDAYLKIDAPVDSWDVGSQLDKLKSEVPPYYNAMAWSIMERHLPEVLPVFLEDITSLPPAIQNLVESSATAILQSYTGMEPEEIGEAIRLYRQTQGVTTPAPVAQTQGSVPPVDLAQLAYQNNLDVNNPAHAALLQNLASQARELNQLRSSVNELTRGEQSRVEQGSQARVNEQIESFKTNLLSKVTVPPGYEYVKNEITDRVMSAFERDPVVRQARTNLEKFYKQGTPDLRAAASEVTKIQTALANHVKAISEPRLKEIQDLETLKTLTSQTQAGVKNIPAGTGTGTPMAPQGKIDKPISPDSIGDLAWERYKASRVKPTLP